MAEPPVTNAARAITSNLVFKRSSKPDSRSELVAPHRGFVCVRNTSLTAQKVAVEPDTGNRWELLPLRQIVGKAFEKNRAPRGLAVHAIGDHRIGHRAVEIIEIELAGRGA